MKCSIFEFLFPLLVYSLYIFLLGIHVVEIFWWYDSYFINSPGLTFLWNFLFMFLNCTWFEDSQILLPHTIFLAKLYCLLPGGSIPSILLLVSKHFAFWSPISHTACKYSDIKFFLHSYQYLVEVLTCWKGILGDIRQFFWVLINLW